jgi:hypothetical protein
MKVTDWWTTTATTSTAASAIDIRRSQRCREEMGGERSIEGADAPGGFSDSMGE